MIYLDNAATTPISEAALETHYQIQRDIFGNPSSLHTHGRKAAQILREARQTIAAALKTSANRLIFTSGGTEANNLAITGYALANQDKGKHLITTAIEHHSVLQPMKDLAKTYGFELTIIQPVDGQITSQQIEDSLKSDTILVSVMHTNNETGDQLPISEIGHLLKNHQAAFHVDAVQALGKIPLAPEEDHIDFLTASAHKFHGPKGVGFLYASHNQFKPLLLGGNQEDKRRASTENIAAIAAMAKALSTSLNDYQNSTKHVSRLKQELVLGLKNAGIAFHLNETGLSTTPYILNIGFPNQLNERLLMQLDLAGISVSSGSACTAGNIEPSHVLAALYGKNSPRLKESIRISFSKYNQSEDIQTLITNLVRIIGD